MREKVLVELGFYLEAWQFCQQNGLDYRKCIRKKSFRTWQVFNTL